ncbi:MAG: zf-HC2 domain-containing protein [Candidatus Aminicenantes bacterium]|nr:zf-HC2 domain-containing protein [Candidatus Aminicenantes bacterium]
MKDCRQVKTELVAYLSQELTEGEGVEVEKHLQGCLACQRELEEWKKVFHLVSEVKEEAQTVANSIDWSAEASRIVDNTWKPIQKQPEKKRSWSFPGWRWQPLAAGLSLGLFLGAILTYLLITTGQVRFSSRQPDSNINLPQGFVEKVDLELARKQTIGYLETSEYLLSELLSNRKPEDFSSLLTSEKLREVLTEKKYLNDHLEDLRLRKAKNICDQIEMLFLELLQLSPQMSEIELEKIRQLVEEKQLILKINLVKKELQRGEV